MLTVLTWFWDQPGGRTKYEAYHVNIWADMVRRHLSMPHRIACVTDIPEGIDPSIEIISPPRDFEDWRIPSWDAERPQCLRRIAMFGPNAAEIFGERFVCMDLDCVVGDSLDPLLDVKDDFRIYRGTTPDRLYNGSMILLTAGARPQVYSNFTLEAATEAGRRFIGSDQAWISHCLGGGEATWGPEHGVNWWGGEKFRSTDSRLLFFPGHEKPWNVVLRRNNSWVSANYHRSPQGKGLLLGYHPSVWKEVEAALLQNTFKGVIASPEAAAVWPGDVFAVADDDRHAERLARMHGFEDFVFCGRTPAL